MKSRTTSQQGNFITDCPPKQLLSGRLAGTNVFDLSDAEIQTALEAADDALNEAGDNGGRLADWLLLYSVRYDRDNGTIRRAL